MMKVLGERARGNRSAVSFQWKNPDFLLKNPDFLLKNPDFITKHRARWRRQSTSDCCRCAFQNDELCV